MFDDVTFCGVVRPKSRAAETRPAPPPNPKQRPRDGARIRGLEGQLKESEQKLMNARRTIDHLRDFDIEMRRIVENTRMGRSKKKLCVSIGRLTEALTEIRKQYSKLNHEHEQLSKEYDALLKEHLDARASMASFAADPLQLDNPQP